MWGGEINYMKKQNLKRALHLLICIGASFLLIYLFVFFGGWQLFEAGDPILYEIAAAIGVGFIIWLMYEVSVQCDARIKALEKRISELEKCCKTDGNKNE